METNLTQGSVLKRLIVFALPFLASNVVQSLYNVADMLIVGQFASPAAMSGVNIGGQVTFVLTNIIIGLCVGATVLIGQYIGKGDREGLKKVTATIITLLLIASVAITVLTLVFKTPLLRLLKTPAESFGESDAYLTVTVAGLIFIFAYNAFAAILRGMGDSKRPLYFVTAACVTNVVLDLLLVAVFHMGAFGAALATVASQAMSVVLCVRYMIKNNFQFDFRPKSFQLDKIQLRLIFKIGLPTCAQNAVVSVSFLFITAIVNMIGGDSPIPSAAVGAVGKFNSFAFMPVQAISASIAAMAAQNIGAGRLDRAVRTCQIGTLFSICLMYAFFVFVQIFPEPILRIFSSDAAYIRDGAVYFHAFAFDFLFIPFNFCITALLIGGGHTGISLVSSVLTSVLLRVPICYIFGIVMDMGLFGVGLGAPVASLGSLIVLVAYMFTGRWKVNKVEHREPLET